MTSNMDSPSTPASPRYLLVMTATVTPAANAQVKRSSPRVRLEDYKRALRFWLGYAHAAAERILFLENSGADLSPLRGIAENENPRRREVEFLSLPTLEIPAGMNYGYTEMQTLDEGLALSKLRPATTHMIKATGRLTFPALGKALDRVTKFGHNEAAPLELMIDCRKLGFPRRGHDASVQLFVCSHDFYDRVLRGSSREMNSSEVRLLEHLMFRKVFPFKNQPGHYLRFPCNIDPVGYFGSKDRRYDSPLTAPARGIRALLRVIAPGYWF
ncbi:MAG: hypothetical protein ABSB50_02560 [Terracidiphilus sp.]|jgi:hypothetical protein